MSGTGFLYYLPGIQASGNFEQLAAEHGLDYILEPGRKICGCPAAKGPENGPPGVVLSGTEITINDRGFHPDRQTWHRHYLKVNGQSIWFGHLGNIPPGPMALLRERILSGHLLRLDDDQIWHVPAALDAQQEGNELRIPRKMGVNDDGEWVYRDFHPRYAHLWHILGRYYALYDQKDSATELSDGENFEVETEDTTKVDNDCEAILATNYRISRAEIGLLGIFGPDTWRDILDALADGPTRSLLETEAELKKNSLASAT